MREILSAVRVEHDGDLDYGKSAVLPPFVETALTFAGSSEWFIIEEARLFSALLEDDDTCLVRCSDRVMGAVEGFSGQIQDHRHIGRSSLWAFLCQRDLDKPAAVIIDGESVIFEKQQTSRRSPRVCGTRHGTRQHAPERTALLRETWSRASVFPHASFHVPLWTNTKWFPRHVLLQIGVFGDLQIKMREALPSKDGSCSISSASIAGEVIRMSPDS